MKQLHPYLLLAIMLVFTSGVALGQRTWFEIGVSKSLTEKLKINLDPEIRFKEGFELNEYFIEPGLEYEFFKFLSLGGSYRIGNNLKKDGSSQWFGRYALEMKGEYDWKKLEAQLRIRYTNYDDLIGENDDKVNYLRFKFKVEYEIEKLDLKPYVVYEIYRDLHEKEFSKARWEAGLEYKINKHNDVGAYFRLNDYLNDKESVKIIGIFYKLEI